MRKIAIITAAGYKGASTQLPDVPECCPEALLPLGGTTILGRQVKQLNALGFECHVTVGKPGCLYRATLKWAKEAYGLGELDDSQSPWTDDRVNYVRSLGVQVVIIKNPDGRTASDSRLIAMDKIGYEWDKLLISNGDHAYTDRIIEAIATAPFPCQVRQCRKLKLHNAVFILNPDAARLFYKFSRTHREMGMRAWFGNTSHEFGDVHIRGGRSTGEVFSDTVPLRYIHEHFPGYDFHEWATDVDYPGTYLSALHWYQTYCSEGQHG